MHTDLSAHFNVTINGDHGIRADHSAQGATGTGAGRVNQRRRAIPFAVKPNRHAQEVFGTDQRTEFAPLAGFLGYNYTTFCHIYLPPCKSQVLNYQVRETARSDKILCGLIQSIIPYY
jgi:hypothetical protein